MNKKSTPRLKGTVIYLAGEPYVAPPLSLGAIERLQDKLQTLHLSENPLDNISTVVDAAFASLQRNYPEITREEVADGISLTDMQSVMNAVMAVSLMEETSDTGE